MPKKPGFDSALYTITSVRITKESLTKLRQIAGQLQADTGEPIAVSDLIRYALDNFITSQEDAQQ